MHDHSLSETTFAVATLGCKVNQADSEAIGEQMNAAGFVQRDFHEIADVYIVNTCTVTHLGDRSSRHLISQARRRHPDALLVVTGCYAELNPQAVKALPGVDLVVGNSGKDMLVEAIKERWERYQSQGTHEHDAENNTAPLLEHPISPRALLPMVPLDTQHIGSDATLIGTDEEPQPDNQFRLFPLVTQEARLSAPSAGGGTWRTRVQMKVQDGCDNRCTYCIVPYVRGGSRSRSIASVVEHVQRKVRAG